MTLIGAANETLAWHAGARSLGVLDGITLPSRGRVLAPAPSDMPEAALTEGNRSVVVPRITAAVGGRPMHLSVKGCGALAPMYGEAPFRSGARGARRITRESWMGEAPFGGQSETNAMAALALSRLAIDGVLAGFHLCPTVEVVEVPEALVDHALAYRRHVGSVVQEQRLVPSDVRLFAASEHTLGRHADAVLHAFGVQGVEALESFLATFAKTAIAALTLFARTCIETDRGLVGLDYDDVWLDKDAVLAPDGALFFVDLEALEWTPAWPSLEQRVGRQVGRNAYEVLYALDVLLDVRERWRGRRPSAIERRAALSALLEIAVADDAFVHLAPARGGLDLIVHAAGREIPLPLLDDTHRASARAEGETRCE